MALNAPQVGSREFRFALLPSSSPFRGDRACYLEGRRDPKYVNRQSHKTGRYALMQSHQLRLGRGYVIQRTQSRSWDRRADPLRRRNLSAGLYQNFDVSLVRGYA